MGLPASADNFLSEDPKAMILGMIHRLQPKKKKKKKRKKII